MNGAKRIRKKQSEARGEKGYGSHKNHYQLIDIIEKNGGSGTMYLRRKKGSTIRIKRVLAKTARGSGTIDDTRGDSEDHQGRGPGEKKSKEKEGKR